MRDGAEVVATVDDDNIPFEEWGENLLINKKKEMPEYSAKLFDPLSKTSAKKYWHRGFPPQLFNERFDIQESKKEIETKVQVDLWNGKPDVDAFSKMVHGYKDVEIESDFPFASQRTIFSSQNAFIHRDVLPYYAVLPFCGRMDDIWGCIVMQKMTEEHVVFNKPSTFHERNEHNLISDLKEEIVGYEKTMEVLKKGIEALPEKTQEFFDHYQKEMKC